MANALKYIVGTAALVGGGYFIYKYLKTKKGVPQPIGDTTPASAVSNIGSSVKPAVAQYFPLARGSKGQKVMELQKAILQANPTLLPKYGVDGKFGPETEHAVHTLLGKNTVDSQEDIIRILNLSSAGQVAASGLNNDRVMLANGLISAIQGNALRYFYTTNTTGVEYGTVNGTTYQKQTVRVLAPNAKLAGGPNTHYLVNKLGYIIAINGSNYVSFSPYAVEVK